MTPADAAAHRARILAVLELLRDQNVTPAEAILACEDAIMACHVGLVLGLTMPSIAAQVSTLLGELDS